MPRLPRETKVDVAKPHACHAKRRCVAPSTTTATQHTGGCPQVPRLPNETKVDVAKYHTCQATHSPQVPPLPCETKVDVAKSSARLPREAKVDVTKRHSCHAKQMWMPPSATQMPRRPRKTTKVDVTKCNACHAKRRWMSPRATPATQSAAASPATKRAQARPQIQPSAASATPATRSEGGCRQVPAMPATHSAAASPATEHAQARPSTPPDPTQCRKCNACHAKRRWMSPSATPATQNEGGKMVCDKVVADKDSSECERWCVTKLWATKMV